MQSHAILYAKRVTPSRKSPYPAGSSVETFGSGVWMNKGRGRGCVGSSACFEPAGLALEDCDGVLPGNGTSVYLYEESNGNIVGVG